MMSELFANQDYSVPTWKHSSLPLILSANFHFYRCVEFNDNLYNKTVSSLHSGNLRVSRTDNRYSTLFPGQKLSYWADSPQTARAEVKKWGASNNLLTFWAYDDSSSFVPTLYPKELLCIIDGVHLGFDLILKKMNENLPLSSNEKELVEKIALEEPDCLAYHSEARKGGTCFLFFERGFRKLSLREVSLRLGSQRGKNHTTITCATSSDFTPILESYGNYFLPIARVGSDAAYKNEEEYMRRKQAEIYSWEQIHKSMK